MPIGKHIGAYGHLGAYRAGLCSWQHELQQGDYWGEEGDQDPQKGQEAQGWLWAKNGWGLGNGCRMAWLARWVVAALHFPITRDPSNSPNVTKKVAVFWTSKFPKERKSFHPFPWSYGAETATVQIQQHLCFPVAQTQEAGQAWRRIGVEEDKRIQSQTCLPMEKFPVP